MAEGKALETHPQFALWFGEVSMDGAKRESRWKAVDALATKVDHALVEVLVRLAFGTKAPAGGTKQLKLPERLASFHAAFREHDEAYDDGAAREIQILAAVTLIHSFRTSPVAALAVTTTTLDGERKPELPMDLTAIANNFIAQHAELRRKRPNLTALSAKLVDLPFAVDSATVNATNPPVWNKPFEDLRAAAETAIKTMGQRLNSSVQTMGKWMQVADEELQMLWWLVGERSLDLGIPFKKIATAKQPLIFGKELADRTVGAPGPLAVSSLLARAGLKAEGKCDLVTVINSVDDAWAVDATNDLNASPVTSPIHFALEKRIETGAGKAWAPGWAAITDLPQELGATPLALGELFYRERLILLSDK